MPRTLIWCTPLALFTLFAVLGLGSSVDSGSVQPSTRADRVRVARTAECRWTPTPITLDGKLTEAAWEKAQVVDGFAVYWENRPAKTATKARVLWDDHYLYFAAEMEDTDLYADIKEHNGMCWYNDVFEMFFKPADDKLAYYEFQVNAANTQLEMFLPARGAGGYGRFKDSRLGIESAVTLQGTLNDWRDKDIGWIVEGRIPWTGFQATGGKPKAGDQWRFSMCRYDYSVAFDRVETSSCAPLTRGDFHRYEDFGRLTFVGP